MNWKGQTIRDDTIVMCIRDSCGDLPKNIVGKYGIIESRNKLHDEMGFRAYDIVFDGEVRTRVLWEDEFETVREE